LAGEVVAVRLRPLAVADAPELARLLRENEAELAPSTPDGARHPATVEAQRERLAKLERDHGEGRRYSWAILEDGALVGTISLVHVMRGAIQSANVGYWVDRPRNGRGIATAAVRQVAERAFWEVGLHRLEAATLPHNRASQRVLEKSGFERIGLARGYLLIDGVWRDHVLFQRTADE
jgi:[ribosomal protein S5]-alanine N-acetyltransferase